MFRIRREQKLAFREDAIRDFENRMVAHVERCFPECLEELGTDGVRRVIRVGIERAADLGVVAERDVCKYIDLMLVFGTDFDRECAWAKEVIDATVGAGAAACVSSLYIRALEDA